MTRLTKSYLTVLLLLAVGLAVVLADGILNTPAPTDQLPMTLAGLPGPSLAVPYFESRWRLLHHESGLLFPGMRPLSTMDFVYAQ